MDAGQRGDRFRELEEAYRGYHVYDRHYERVGKVDDLFVDENDRPEYVGVKTGFLGTKSTLIPMEIVRINDRRRLLEVAADKDTITHAPSFDDDAEITPEHEARIYGYFGLEHPGLRQGRGGYGDYYASDTTGEASREEELRRTVDTEYGERRDEPLAHPTGETAGSGTSSGAGEPPPGGPAAEPGYGDREAPPEYAAPGTEESRRADAGEVSRDRVRIYKRVRPTHG